MHIPVKAAVDSTAMSIIFICFCDRFNFIIKGLDLSAIKIKCISDKTKQASVEILARIASPWHALTAAKKEKNMKMKC